MHFSPISFSLSLPFRALEKNGTIITYWQNAAVLDRANNLAFSENESMTNIEALAQQSYKQHGYQMLDKIDQLIMILVTRVTTTSSNDSILKEYFHRVAQSHSEYRIKQDHVDVRSDHNKSKMSFFFQMLCVSFIECLKNLVYQNGHEWTIKHEMTWMKLLTLLTTPFLSSQINSSLSTKITS